MLITKCIFAPVEKDDGLRVSIMSRHTLNDGITPDRRITRHSYENHYQMFAPPLTTVGAWYKEKIDWEEFTRQYTTHLEEKYVREHLAVLAREALHKNITLLCVEPTEDQCHRGILARICQELEPTLTIKHVPYTEVSANSTAA